jgi:preprotein translocase subunit YajC
VCGVGHTDKELEGVSDVDPISLLMIGALALLVMFMVRNSKKQRATQMELQEKLVPGAEVMTSFGLYANVVSIDDDTNIAVIDAGSGTLLRVHRQTLTKVVAEDVAPEPEAIDDTVDGSDAAPTDKKDS